MTALTNKPRPSPAAAASRPERPKQRIGPHSAIGGPGRYHPDVAKNSRRAGARSLRHRAVGRISNLRSAESVHCCCATSCQRRLPRDAALLGADAPASWLDCKLGAGRHTHHARGRSMPGILQRNSRPFSRQRRLRRNRSRASPTRRRAATPCCQYLRKNFRPGVGGEIQRPSSKPKNKILKAIRHSSGGMADHRRCHHTNLSPLPVLHRFAVASRSISA